MKFRVEKYLYEKTKNAVFITLKNKAELPVKGYEVPKSGLDVPILTEDFIKNVKTNDVQNNITIASIIKGMIYIMGIDNEFKYNDEYKKFLRLADENIEDYIGHLAFKKFKEKEFMDSLIFFKALIALNDKNLNGLYNYALVCQEIGKIHEKNEQKQESEDFLKEALDKLENITYLYPDFSGAYYQLGYHYYNQKQYIKAKLTFEEALSLGVDEQTCCEIKKQLNEIQYKVDYEQGYNYILEGKVIEGFEKLLPLEKEHGQWWNLLFFIGLGYRQLNDIPNALNYFERILMLNPEQSDTIVEMGLCYAMMSNMKKSIECFERALLLNDKDTEIICNLAMAHLQDDNVEKAKEYITMAYEMNPNDEITISCMNEIKKCEK